MAWNCSPTDDLGLLRASWSDGTIHYHPRLNVQPVHKEETALLLIGYIIDPMKPSATNADILQHLAESSITRESLFGQVQGLSGRFILVYSTSEDLIALSDACGCRQLFYSVDSTACIITSSVTLFHDFVGGQCLVSEAKKGILESHAFDASERAWFGAEAADDRLGKVLPGHFVDLKTGKQSRIPLDRSQIVTGTDTVDYAADILKGSVEAIFSRFSVVQPLTAGWDSRSLLAARRSLGRDLEQTGVYFSFLPTDSTGFPPDATIPLRLCARLNLPFELIRPAKAGETFLQWCRDAFRIDLQEAKAAQIRYLLRRFGSENSARLSGVAGGVFKPFYGHTRSKVTDEMLYSFTPYYRKSRYVLQQINDWLKSANEFCSDNGVSVLDLFYLEQRLGHWGAEYAFEQDIAMEEFWPHGNRNMLFSVMQVDPRLRARPKCAFYRNLISQMWADALLEPCNPTSLWRRMRTSVRNFSSFRYYKARLAPLADAGRED